VSWSGVTKLALGHVSLDALVRPQPAVASHMTTNASPALAVCLVTVTALCWPAEAHADAALIARGHAIARYNCSRCHAIGKTGLSTNPKSPPFRLISRRYSLTQLQEALAEGIMVGHEGLEMPHFQFSPAQIDALLAYMASVQAK
jgi:cytochrome c